MIDTDKQREIVRLKLVDKLSERQISRMCKCSRKTVSKYVMLFIDWLETEKAVLEMMSRLESAAFINHLTDVINKGEWVVQLLQMSMVREVREAKKELEKTKKDNDYVKVMEIFKWLSNQRGSTEGVESKEERNLSYSTIYLASKFKEAKK